MSIDCVLVSFSNLIFNYYLAFQLEMANFIKKFKSLFFIVLGISEILHIFSIFYLFFFYRFLLEIVGGFRNR